MAFRNRPNALTGRSSPTQAIKPTSGALSYADWSKNQKPYMGPDWGRANAEIAQKGRYQDYLKGFSKTNPLTDDQLRAYGWATSSSGREKSHKANDYDGNAKPSPKFGFGEQVTGLPKYYTEEYGYNPDALVMPNRELTRDEQRRANDLRNQDMGKRPAWAKSSSNLFDRLVKEPVQRIGETAVKGIKAAAPIAAV